NIKKLLLLAVMPMIGLTVNAQESKIDFTPKKGDVTLAFTLGYNSYASVEAPALFQNYYFTEAQSTNWSDKKLMVGFEAGWFVSDLWKLSLGGGLNFTNNPGHPGVPGTVENVNYDNPYDMMGELPNLVAVADAQSFSYNVALGLDRYFKLNSVTNLMPYLGVRGGYAYGQNQKVYDEPYAMGKSSAESFNIRGAVAFGLDYYILPGFYLGAQIEPFAYTYNRTVNRVQEGLERHSANSHNFNFLAAPTIKIGFKIGKSNKGRSAFGDNTEELNRISNELRAIRENQPKEIIHVDTVTVKEECPPAKPSGLKGHVTFTIGSSRVTELEEMNILAISEYMQKNPDAKAIVYGYADNGTGNDATNQRLAKQRADAVAKLLTDKYGVSANRVEVQSMQNREQAFQTNNWNRVVVVTAEE
ncbi:MAG: OmpA family protein, partial [Bacteroidaceae bacterium]|nr:OmpA family protein [Bacteroidaceae bacterium]